MKHVILIFGIFILLTSCSQKQFAFRKKITVVKTEALTFKVKSEKADPITEVNAADISNPISVTVYQQPLPFVEQTNAISTPANIVLPEDTIRKRYKFDDDLEKKEKSTESALSNSEDNSSWFSWGFGNTLLAILVTKIFDPKGEKGLKSKFANFNSIMTIVLISMIVLFLLFIAFMYIFYPGVRIS